MRPATPATLDLLKPVLAQLRKLSGLRERKQGIFYRGPSAFLHFHEDAAGIFADLRTAGGWKRLPVNTRTQSNRLLRLVSGVLQGKLLPR